MNGPLSLPVQLLCPEPVQPALDQALALLTEALTGWETQNPTWSPSLHFAKVRKFVEAQAAPAPLSPVWCAAIDDELEATAAEDAQPVAWFAFADSNGPVPLELWGWDEKACRNAVLTYARGSHWKGTVEGYLFDQQWTLRAVYLAAQPVALEPVAYTYSSTQATNCAGCGKHQHTPLRIDAMGGYICLTCIDTKLGEVLGEFGYAAPQEPLTDDEITAIAVDMADNGWDDIEFARALFAAARGVKPANAKHIADASKLVSIPPAAVAEGLERDGSSLEQAA